MAKNRLISAIFWLVAAAGLSLSLAACNGGENPHSHTFAEGWTAGETTHWHAATCEHSGEKSGEAPHVDADANGKCDVCGYVMPPEEGHTHTFDDSHWEHDENTHWHAATCGHTDQKADEAPHVDEDENQMCDVCEQFIEHVHKFSETEWAFDESTHWRPAICTHKTEKGGETEHTFTEGVCVCGVKETEIDVYNALTELEMTEDAFADWRAAIKADGVTDVKITSQNDILYMRDDETEVCYVADRTVKAKVTDVEGKGVAEVWLKVAYDNDEYTAEHSNSNALAVAKTNANGEAELTFSPVGGYTSATVKYLIKYAEAKDVAVLESVEEESVKVFPSRYITGTSISQPITVGEEDSTGSLTGNLSLKFDASWSAADKTVLKYARYPQNAVEGTNIREEGQTTTLNSSGGGMFDYLLFIPSQRYSWAQGSGGTQFDAITENFNKAASGVYEISFTASDDSARLYYWEGDLDLIANKKNDGTPKDDCAVSVSGTKPEGSTIADKVFTGANNIKITIMPDGQYAMQHFQLGLLCQSECEVVITVTRTGDYIPPASNILKLGENIAQTDGIPGYKITKTATTKFKLDQNSNITDGLYTIEVIPHDEYCEMPKTTEVTGQYYNGAALYSVGVMQCTVGSSKTMLWQASKDGKPAEKFYREFTLYDSEGADTGYTRSVMDLKNVSLKGVVHLTPASEISITCTVNVTYYADIVIQPYNSGDVQTLEGSAETIEIDTPAFVPATKRTEKTVFEYDFGDSIEEDTKYCIQLDIPRSYVFNGSTYQITFSLGAATRTIEGFSGDINGVISFKEYTKIKKGDKLKIVAPAAEVNFFMIEITVRLSDLIDIQLNVPQEFKFQPKITDRTYSIEQKQYIYSFTAPQAGSYKLHFELTDNMTEQNSAACASGTFNTQNYVANLNALKICDIIPEKITANTKYMYIYGKLNGYTTGYGAAQYSSKVNAESVTELDLSFSLTEGAEKLINIACDYVYMGATLTVQYKEG